MNVLLHCSRAFFLLISFLKPDEDYNGKNSGKQNQAAQDQCQCIVDVTGSLAFASHP